MALTRFLVGEARMTQEFTMSMFVRYFAMASVSLFVIAALGQLAYDKFCPVPKSTPLVDRAGITLDAATEMKLIEIVFDAARSDDVTTIDEYLKEGFSPNVRSIRGDTLLTVAAYHDSIAVVKRLLTAPGVDIEARNRMGLTAVSAAAFKGYEGSLRELIAAGADVNAKGTMQHTALMFASLSGRSNTVTILLQAGADQSPADDQGNTAISLATTQGADEVVKALTAHEQSDSNTGEK